MRAIPAGATHRDAERLLRDGGWLQCGAGDWAIALRSPAGSQVARISPFDPAGPYNAALYREAAHTAQVPRLDLHRRLAGGGDLQIMQWLQSVPGEVAVGFLSLIATADPVVADLACVVQRVHQRARRELPWCGPLDDNPGNVMRSPGGHLVLIDPFYADGPNLYATAAADPGLVAARIPEPERRYLTEIPMAGSGPWDPAVQSSIRAGLAAEDAGVEPGSH